MKKVLLINNEKDCQETEWVKSFRKNLEKIQGSIVDLTCHRNLASASEYKETYDCLILGGRQIPWFLDEIKQDYWQEVSLIQESNIPILGICGGLQLIGLAYGATWGRMVEGEAKDQEVGFIALSKTSEDPIIKGLPDPFFCYSQHGDELKNLPECFSLLAKSEQCLVQLIRLKHKPVYGLQFHPEKYDKEHPHGQRILSNFIELV